MNIYCDHDDPRIVTLQVTRLELTDLLLATAEMHYDSSRLPDNQDSSGKTKWSVLYESLFRQLQSYDDQHSL